MPRIKGDVRVVSSLPYADGYREVEVPDGRLWEVKGFHLQFEAAISGTCIVTLGYKVPGAGVLYEGATPEFTITGPPAEGVIEVFGMPGTKAELLNPMVGFLQPQASVPMPVSVLLSPRGNVFSRIICDPTNADVNGIFSVLVDESIYYATGP